MVFDRWFRFADDNVNARFISRIKRSELAHSVDSGGIVHFPSKEEEGAEAVIADVRASVFPAWQVLSCPADWTQRYRDEMTRRNVAYLEELNNGAVDFLLEQRHRPHSWKMADVQE